MRYFDKLLNEDCENTINFSDFSTLNENTTTTTSSLYPTTWGQLNENSDFYFNQHISNTKIKEENEVLKSCWT